MIGVSWTKYLPLKSKFTKYSFIFQSIRDIIDKEQGTGGQKVCMLEIKAA
jgi:hypothetical protein